MESRITVREYAAQKRVTLGTAYRRIWEGQVKAEQVYGRWLIFPTENPEPIVSERCNRTRRASHAGRSLTVNKD
jgi:hypothetical protein